MAELTGNEKYDLLRDYATTAGYRTLVETGTADGNCVLALSPYFDFLFTIELDASKYLTAVERTFYDPKITCIHGDSGKVMEMVSFHLKDPAVFWLDGHYNEGLERGDTDCPVREELRWIIQWGKRLNPIILIDDARLFGAEKDYPTQRWVEGQALKHGFQYACEDDIIRLTPKGMM